MDYLTSSTAVSSVLQAEKQIINFHFIRSDVLDEPLFTGCDTSATSYKWQVRKTKNGNIVDYHSVCGM